MESSTSPSSGASPMPSADGFSNRSAKDGQKSDAKPARQSAEPTEKTLHVTFQSMNCLLDILVTLSRIGAKVSYLSAKDNSAILSTTGKPFIIRRIPSLLRELVEVVDMNEL